MTDGRFTYRVCRRFIFHEFITTNFKTNKHRGKTSLRLDSPSAPKHTQRQATQRSSFTPTHSSIFKRLGSFISPLKLNTTWKPCAHRRGQNVTADMLCVTSIPCSVHVKNTSCYFGNLEQKLMDSRMLARWTLKVRKKNLKKRAVSPVFTAQEFGESFPNNRPVTYLLRCVSRSDHLLVRTVTFACLEWQNTLPCWQNGRQTHYTKNRIIERWDISLEILADLIFRTHTKISLVYIVFFLWLISLISRGLFPFSEFRWTVGRWIQCLSHQVKKCKENTERK